MNKADLSAPRAKLDWANNQLTILTAEVNLWRERKPYRIIPKPNPDGPGNFLYLEVTEPLPAMIAMHIGAILAAQRDSLDFLVTALAEKNGANEPRDCYFPIADSEKRFLKQGTQNKIKRLTLEDRAVVHSFKPYKGGNAHLYALNWLCQKGKHRKPILVGDVAQGGRFTGNGCIREAKMWSMQDVESGAPMAFIDADPGIEFNLTMNIAFREAADASARRAIIPALRDFNRLAASIIDVFA